MVAPGENLSPPPTLSAALTPFSLRLNSTPSRPFPSRGGGLVMGWMKTILYISTVEGRRSPPLRCLRPLGGGSYHRCCAMSCYPFWRQRNPVASWAADLATALRQAAVLEGAIERW